MAPETIKRERKVAAFKPSQNGLKFTNRFPGLPLPEPLATLIDTSKSVHGLCGGMVFTTIDYMKAKKEPPATTAVPDEDTKLYEYLKKRQTASWGLLDSQVLRYVWWMGLNDEKAQEETLDSWREIRKKLDKEDFAVVGLIYHNFHETLAVWDNHQVLAYGYQELEDGTIRILLYDPNFPKEDDIYIEAKGVKIKKPGKPEFGMKAGQFKGGKHLYNLHGFMLVPYEYNEPPDGAGFG